MVAAFVVFWHPSFPVLFFSVFLADLWCVREQVQRGWSDRVDWGYGDGLECGHVGGVQGGCGCGGEREGADERRGAWRVSIGCVDVRRRHGIGGCGTEHRDDGRGERERERGGLRDEEVICVWWLL